MEKEAYDKLVNDWAIYWSKESDYSLQRKIILQSKLGDLERDALKRLEHFFGHNGFNSRQFGPWTEIYDKEDLLDNSFILPGINRSFSALPNTDKNIPNYWGKYMAEESGGSNFGEVIGFGYDATDDYILIKLENGERSTILVNSCYKVFDTLEECKSYVAEREKGRCK